MNLTSLKTALKAFGFNDSDPLTEWLNAALHEFEDAYPWPWLEAETTVAVAANVNTLVLPADFYKLMSLRIDGVETSLDYMTVGEFEDLVTNRTDSGLPSVFTVVGTDKILLWATPNTALNFRVVYRKFVADLVNGVDVPAIPIRHHYTLVKGAAKIGLQADKSEERAEKASDQFEADIMRAISRWGTKQEHEPDAVRDTAYYFDS